MDNSFLNKKVFFISAILTFPPDEGLRAVIYNLYKEIRQKTDLLAVTSVNNKNLSAEVVSIALNKFFINRQLKALVSNFKPDIIFYASEASCSFNSFIRGVVLRRMGKGAKVVILGSQHREFMVWQRLLLKFIKPDLLFLLGGADVLFFQEHGLTVKVLPPAIDSHKFHPVSKSEKDILRKKYNISSDKIVISHVGHINRKRNIDHFIPIQKMSNVQVLIVGSTTTAVDSELKSKLLAAGIMIIDTYVEAIEEIYQLSDLYVFPVKRNDAAIEMPLSVLEAMACNLPIVTTRFGGLVDYFKEDEGFRYCDDMNGLLPLIEKMVGAVISNDKKVMQFSWGNFTNNILVSLDELS